MVRVYNGTIIKERRRVRYFMDRVYNGSMRNGEE